MSYLPLWSEGKGRGSSWQRVCLCSQVVQKFTDQLMFVDVRVLLHRGALHAGTVAADMFSSENLLAVPVVMSAMRAMAFFVD